MYLQCAAWHITLNNNMQPLKRICQQHHTILGTHTSNILEPSNDNFLAIIAFGKTYATILIWTLSISILQ